MLPHRPVLAALTSVLVLVGGLAGCSDADEPASRRTQDSATGPSGTPTASPPAAASASASTSASASSAPTRRTPTLVPIEPREPVAKPSRSHLLPVDRLPRWEPGLEWRATTDGPDVDAPAPVGACQRASLVDIGALDAVRRTTTSADGASRITQVVARFPDRTSTWRAHEVLRSWRSDCAEQDRRRVDVGPIETVPVPTGAGEAYVAAYRDSDGARRATGLGIVRKGSWLVVVELATEAQRWPAGWNPTRRTVRRVAATFEG